MNLEHIKISNKSREVKISKFKQFIFLLKVQVEWGKTIWHKWNTKGHNTGFNLSKYITEGD